MKVVISVRIYEDYANQAKETSDKFFNLGWKRWKDTPKAWSSQYSRLDTIILYFELDKDEVSEKDFPLDDGSYNLERVSDDAITSKNASI